MKNVIIFLGVLCIATVSFSQVAEPAVFERAFSGDTTFADPLLPSRFRVYPLGKIKIESGKIMSCDVEEIHNAVALPYKFPLGEFPVELSIMIDVDDLNAYSRIIFSDEPVKTWEFVSSPNIKQNPSDTGLASCRFSFAIGVAVFIDSITNRVLNQKPHKFWATSFIDKIKGSGSPGAIYKVGRHSFAAFSGNQAICYSIYIGYDKDRKICRLLANLGTLNLPGFR